MMRHTTNKAKRATIIGSTSSRRGSLGSSTVVVGVGVVVWILGVTVVHGLPTVEDGLGVAV